MDDVLCVRRLKSIENLNRDVDQAVQLHRAHNGQVLQRDPVQIFHGHEDAAIGLTNVVDCADAGVVQGRSSARLALEAVAQLMAVSVVVREEFQGHKTTETNVLRLVNDAHASRTQLFQDAVVRDGGAEHCCTIDSYSKTPFGRG